MWPNATYGHIRLKEQKLSNLLISEKVSLNLCSMATLQPQRVQHFYSRLFCKLLHYFPLSFWECNGHNSTAQNQKETSEKQAEEYHKIHSQKKNESAQDIGVKPMGTTQS